MSCRRGSTCGSRSSSSSSSFGFSGGSSWFRSFHWPSFFRRKPKDLYSGKMIGSSKMVNGLYYFDNEIFKSGQAQAASIGNDTLTQEVAASRSAFIDWDALFKGFHNSEEHDSSTVFACKMFELWLKDCGKEFPNDGIVCESVRECL
ncbi:uncharacterized protein LOC132267258 isoform X2 [Cornus florida]|uniref:uncharacterized protein LOC132267258 isoform X2 n=1 Tax=Cornus florida TaxID=4283 RepID=UPI0028A2DC73|nr:uncharacterized protein LOC132267258 isoform X2 [Cornus florida]